jgi:hypothetical protein
MSYTAAEIEAYVDELLMLKDTHTLKELSEMEKFTEFRTKNKMLYEMVIDGQFNEGIFKQMMAMKRRLEAGEDQYSVDVRFGTYMKEQYIDPVVKKK